MKRRILLVDDELAILLTLRAVLEMNGFEVETAASAKKRGISWRTALMKNGHHRYADGERNCRRPRHTRGPAESYNPATALLRPPAHPSLGNEVEEQGSAIAAGEAG